MSAEPSLAESGEILPGLAPISFDGPRGRIARDYLLQGREMLREVHLDGASGDQIVGLWTGVVDHVVQSLFIAARDDYRERNATLDQKCALIAQGGYGRGELNPWSDIDLLFLYPQRADAYVETVTESVLYPLWDTGMTVGQAVRSVRDCVSLAAGDFKVKTSLLDTRLLAGDESLYESFEETMRTDVLKRNASKFFREKIAENEERHHKHGDAVFLVEPHLKEGEGGLRDLHTAIWLAKVKFKVRNVEDLVSKGILTESELAEISQARSFLFRVRNGLHFLSNRHLDQLTFEYQERIAADLGFADDAQSRGVEKFMREYYLYASVVNRFAEEMIDRCSEPKGPGSWVGRLASREIRPGVRIVSDELVIADGEMFDRDPSLLLRIFADAQRHDVAFSSGTGRMIRSKAQLLANEKARRDPEAARAFIDILTWKNGVGESLQTMHWLDVLGAYIPEFENLRCMAQYDRYHIYTVDAHTLRAVENLERLRRGAYKAEHPLLTTVVREIEDIEILYLGMLFHDIGKGLGGDHSNKGADMAIATSDRLGLNADATDQFSFLVRNHLLMHTLATRRDIHEPQLVVDFARTVGSVEKLKKLYVLTYADLRATNPKLWNSWQDSLLGELYELTIDTFERGTMAEADEEERVDRILLRTLQRVDADDMGALSAFLEEMPDRYVLSTPEQDLPAHFRLARQLADRDFATQVEHYPERDFSVFTVVTRNQPGLFAKLTGVMRAKGLSVAGARAAIGARGLAVDVFRVAHLDEGEQICSDDRWDRVVALIGDVLAGDLDVAEMATGADRPQPGDQRYSPRVPTEIEIDNNASADFTLIGVVTSDRFGVLFAISSVLFRLDLRVHMAKITTSVDRVLDVFHVTDSEGEKITEARADEVRAALLAAIQPLSEPSPSVTEGERAG